MPVLPKTWAPTAWAACTIWYFCRSGKQLRLVKYMARTLSFRHRCWAVIRLSRPSFLVSPGVGSALPAFQVRLPYPLQAVQQLLTVIDANTSTDDGSHASNAVGDARVRRHRGNNVHGRGTTDMRQTGCEQRAGETIKEWKGQSRAVPVGHPALASRFVTSSASSSLVFEQRCKDNICSSL